MFARMSVGSSFAFQHLDVGFLRNVEVETDVLFVGRRENLTGFTFCWQIWISASEGRAVSVSIMYGSPKSLM